MSYWPRDVPLLLKPMKSKHRLPAFTIMEITVVMLISAIVVAITFTAYGMVSRAYSTYLEKRNRMAVLIRLDELLQRDFRQAQQVLKLENTVFFSDSGRQITYRFEPEQIIRQSTIVDSFKVKVADVVCSFENQPTGETLDPVRIDEVSFTIQSDQETFPYYYTKHYSSANLIQKTDYANH
jgi:type II secretory pathway pseudopilin PulG